MKHVLVTGASTGIGYAATIALLKTGYAVHATVRSQADADKLMALSGDIVPYLMDITANADVDRVVTEIRSNLKETKLYGILNNAGIAVAGPLEHIPMEEFIHQFEVNVFGTLRVIQSFLPVMDEDDGKILYISSKSGLITLPFTAAYSASKRAMEGVMDGFRREMSATGIKFVLIEPSAVKTPIWDKADQINIERWGGTRYEPVMERIKDAVVAAGQNGADVEPLAEMIVDIYNDPDPKPRYLYAANVFSEIILPHRLPDRWLDSQIKKRLWGK